MCQSICLYLCIFPEKGLIQHYCLHSQCFYTNVPNPFFFFKVCLSTSVVCWCKMCDNQFFFMILMLLSCSLFLFFCLIPFSPCYPVSFPTNFSILSEPWYLCWSPGFFFLNQPSHPSRFFPSLPFPLSTSLSSHSLISPVSFAHILFFSYSLPPPWKLPASLLWSWPFCCSVEQIDFLVSSSAVAPLPASQNTARQRYS